MVRRLRLRLDVLRSLLSRKQKPPESEDADPLFQTLRHLQALFPANACPLKEFQLVFARPLMG
jgi:hypothetical protein